MLRKRERERARNEKKINRIQRNKKKTKCTCFFFLFPLFSYIHHQQHCLPIFFSLFVFCSLSICTLRAKCSDSFFFLIFFSVKGNRRNCMQTNGHSVMMNLKAGEHLVWQKSLNHRLLLSKEWFVRLKELT